MCPSVISQVSDLPSFLDDTIKCFPKLVSAIFQLFLEILPLASEGRPCHSF
jgi:hypothetical protein